MGTTLTIIFIVLKVLNMVAFGWGIVFLPLIIEWSLAILGFGIIVIFFKSK